MTGLSGFTLRNWERRYSFPAPKREKNGYRAYSLVDVKILRQVAFLVKAGHRVNELMPLIAEGKPLPSAGSHALLNPQHQMQLEILYSHLIHYEIERAELSLSNLTLGISVRQSMEQVYQPLLQKLGADWARGTLCVAQEHFASGFLRLRISPFLAGPAAPSVFRKKAVLATLESDLHEGGLMLFAIHLKLLGWEVYYFGPNLPAEELAGAVKGIRPNLVALSSSDPKSLAAGLPSLGKLPAFVCLGGIGTAELDDEYALPANSFVFDTSAQDAADLIDGLSLDFLAQFARKA